MATVSDRTARRAGAAVLADEPGRTPAAVGPRVYCPSSAREVTDVLTWDPLLDVSGDKDVLKVSATDVGTDSACGRYAALKTRPFVKAAAWRRACRS